MFGQLINKVSAVDSLIISFISYDTTAEMKPANNEIICTQQEPKTHTTSFEISVPQKCDQMHWRSKTCHFRDIRTKKVRSNALASQNMAFFTLQRATLVRQGMLRKTVLAILKSRPLLGERVGLHKQRKNSLRPGYKRTKSFELRTESPMRTKTTLCSCC